MQPTPFVYSIPLSLGWERALDRIPDSYTPIVFLIFFVGFWVFVANRLANKAGWPKLVENYPNRDDAPIRTLRFQSGWVGSVSMSSVLRLEVCESGLRVGILKMFGPFSRDFFVPWTEIAIERGTRRFFSKVAILNFGAGVGQMTLFDYTANQIARYVPQRWPEKRIFPPDSYPKAAWEALKLWLIGMAFIMSFFTIIPLLQAKHGFQAPPLEVPLMFGAMLGVAAFRVFLSRVSK